MLEVKNCDDMNAMTSDDILSFMKEQTAEDIVEFKKYCNTPLIKKYEDGTEKERLPVFFEIRRWIVNKYFPEALKLGKNRVVRPSFLDRINEL